ncbi:LegC family aminotransferase [Campylobacter upsaliensis]|uniref:LegC family aminotransferase n=1 Tax=Campylobacter upsaliensis TaxID=28080 RepID=UPI0012C43D73|nr:LegC family aminotransferase [Campylobacter upsaliensis]EAK0298603.1 LegC family aminotransferase [Campylobacter upsaliensis]MCR2118855.1 LegC family aminotransferase [Campylobacter upsaliensis]
MFEKEIAFIKNLYKKEQIALHEPCFGVEEKTLLNECIESGFVSSVGKFVGEFEEQIKKFSKAKYAIATNSGTSALHIALLANKVDEKCEVITQALSFVATANAIAYTGAKPIFLDVSLKTLSLSAKAVSEFLTKNTFMKNKKCFNKHTKKHIKALVLMHTFGLSGEIVELKKLCEKYHLILIEDAAEALGSFYHNKALGTFGKCGIYSFNGNKIITGGCGGVILSDDEKIAKRARHLSTTAKIPHAYHYKHDMLGFNYRLCNVNAALLVAQMKKLNAFLKDKRNTAKLYKEFFKESEFCEFVDENEGEKSNFWLCALKFKKPSLRKEFIKVCLANQIFVRPVWKSLAGLKMYRHCQKDTLKNTKILEKTLLNLPSSVRA